MKKCKCLLLKPQQIKPKKITGGNFKKYGWVIGWNDFKENLGPNKFRIVVREKDPVGWRIAYLIVREKTICKLEQHINSKESFETVSGGRSILYVAGGKKPKNIEAFYLDKPIVLKKGVWHGIVTLGKETHVKITENNDVDINIHELEFALK
ncbi:MAG: hypothetical protein ABII88_04835 [Candidatus Omnitrophota bacterium]